MRSKSLVQLFFKFRLDILFALIKLVYLISMLENLKNKNPLTSSSFKKLKIFSYINAKFVLYLGLAA